MPDLTFNTHFAAGALAVPCVVQSSVRTALRERSAETTRTRKANTYQQGRAVQSTRT